MSDENNLFFPLFYNTLEITESLSDAEFGELIRELLRSRGNKEYSANLPPNLILAYRFMLDNAIRIFNTSGKRTPPNKEKPRKREYNFDAEEAFQLALSRTYQDQ